MQEKFYASAAEYAQITDLSRRVAEWEEKIQPKLEEEVSAFFLFFDMYLCRDGEIIILFVNIDYVKGATIKINKNIKFGL